MSGASGCAANATSRAKAHEALAFSRGSSDLLETLRRHDFTVPQPVQNVSGERQVDGLVVFTFLEGKQPEGRRDWQLVSDELRRLHELTRAWPQRPGFRTSRDLLTENVGGDVDMSLLHPTDAALCRDAWSDLPRGQESVVHGDPSASNILIDGDRVGLLDWDEARVDSPLLDLGALPDAELAALPTGRLPPRPAGGRRLGGGGLLAVGGRLRAAQAEGAPGTWGQVVAKHVYVLV